MNMTVENGCSPYEAENASNQIKKLMEKYSISDDDLNNAHIDIDLTPYYLHPFGDEHWSYNQIPRWEKVLLHGVHACMGSSILFGKDSELDDCYFVNGILEDSEVAEYCLDVIRKQVSELSEQYILDNNLRRNSKKSNSFLLTLAVFTVEKISDILKGIQSPTKLKNALAEAEGRKDKALKLFAEAKGIEVHSPRAAKVSINIEGYEASKNISVSGAMSGSVKQAMLSN